MTETSQMIERFDRWALLSGLASHTLDKNWSIRPLHEFCHGRYAADEAGWLPITLPAHWQQYAELENHTGKVVYRCPFKLPPAVDTTGNGTQATRVWLRFNGVFYWSEPYLNGKSLGRHEGYFVPNECEVTDLLQGDNTLLVEVDCPDEHDKFGKEMITGIFSHWDCFDPTANPGGIWLPVELVTSGPMRVKTVRCRTDSFNEAVAQVHYTAEVDTALSGPVVLRWIIEPRNFEGSTQIIEQRRTLREGHREINGLFKIRDPHLWWTWDLGDPDLYTITLEVLSEGVVSDRHRSIFGIRHFELRNWVPHLNGVRFLIKGNNYAPDMRIATMTPERYQEDLALVRGCNMNFLRIHAHVDHPALYRTADAVGVLLWQDLPLQWLYRARVLPRAVRQVRSMVRLLYNHPSIVIWCMHNEPVFVADTADERLLMRLRTYASTFGFSWNRDVMDNQLKRVVQKEDPHRCSVRSSGEFYIPFWKDGTDAHGYFGWYSAYGSLMILERLFVRLSSNARFVTEFGAQSFPNAESCVRFMPADIDQIDFDYLARRHGFQGDVMSRWIAWRKSASLVDLVDITQDYQIYIHRYCIDNLRYRKYRPTGGIAPFLFIDPYPAVLWSVVDYWRVPKRSYYALRMAFNPQYAFTLYEPRTYRLAEPINLPIYVINDAQHPVHDLHLTVRLCHAEGDDIATVEHTLSLDADCSAQEIDRLRLTPTQVGHYTLYISLTGVEQETHQAYTIEVI